MVVRSVQKLNQRYINLIVKKALNEDLNPKGDITTKILFVVENRVRTYSYLKI